MFLISAMIMAGILISTRTAFIFSIIGSIAYGGIGWLEIHKILVSKRYWNIQGYNELDILIFIIFFFVIATVSYLSNREIERSLCRAKKSEAELKQEKELLEIRVKERTEEIQKLQAEKMHSVYRFAEIGRLSAGIFHDIINPLTAFSLNIASIKKDVDTKFFLNNSIAAAKRMEKLILAFRNQLKGQEEKKIFSPAKEIKYGVFLLAHKINESKAKVTYRLDENLQLYGNPTKFSQIITNLISNAIDAYGSTVGEIIVELKESGQNITLLVEDFGCGILEENIEKIFEPFFSTKPPDKGAGIGLSLVKDTVEKDFGGTVEVQSRPGQGTKFIVKLPEQNSRPENKNINQENLQKMPETTKEKDCMLLTAALKLSCLASAVENETVQRIKKEAADFILSQREKNWTVSNSAAINFLCLGALSEYNSNLIDGIALAKILISLAAIEEREGGPYFSSMDKTDQTINLETLVAIAYFLAQKNAELESLDKIIDCAIDCNFKNPESESRIFTDKIFIIYLIAKAYKSRKDKNNQKQKLISHILNQNQNKGWHNILSQCVAVSSLAELGYPTEKPSIQNIEKLNLRYPYLREQDSTASLNTAFYITATSGMQNSGKAANKQIEINYDLQEKNIAERIISTAQKSFLNLSPEMQKIAMAQINRTLRGNTDKQMSMMAEYTRHALGQKGKIFSDQYIAKLGLMNTFFWTAFIIYDDFWDEDESADPKTLPTANLYSRQFIQFFSKLLPKHTGFKKFFNNLMNKLDMANTWENVYCRAKVENKKFFIPQNLPDYGNYEKKYQPASGHILGPVVMLLQSGHKLNCPHVQNFISYFKNYLIAMQINDDAHDWKEDMERGHLSTVVVMLIKDWQTKHPDKKEIDLENDLEELQQIFWFKTIITACAEAIKYSDRARQVLKSISIFKNIAPLEKYCDMTKNVAQQALDKQKESVAFLNQANL